MAASLADDPLSRAAARLPAATAGGTEEARRVITAVLRFLARRWPILLLLTGLLGYGVWSWSKSLPRTYGCSPAVIELVQDPPSSARTLESYEYAISSVAWYVVPTQMAVLSTSQVLDPVVERLGLVDDPDYGSLGGQVVATAREYTTLISLTVNGPDPEKNALVANAVADEYAKLRGAERDRFLNRLYEDGELQVRTREADLAAAEGKISDWRTANQVTDVRATEETARARMANLFTLVKAAEADRDRALVAEQQVLEAERDKRDLADVGAVREDPTVRAAIDDLERLQRDAEELQAQLPEGSAKPELLLARSRRDTQRQRVRGLVSARAEELKIVARNARARAEHLGVDLGKEQKELERIITLGVEHGKLAAERDRAAMALAEAKEDQRAFADMKARKADPVQIRQRATVSRAVVSPRLSVIYIGGALLSLLTALGVALVVDLTSRKLRDPQDIGRVAEAPYLGAVPLFPLARGEKSPSRTVLEEIDGDASEAYRLIAATSMLHGGDGDAPKVIAVTSPQAGDGKTTTAIGFAVSLARRGGRVLLVDADLRKPSIHGVLEIPSEPGLTNLFGGQSVWEAVRTVEIAPPHHEAVRFDVLTAGILPPNPGDILPSPRMQAFLAEARERYDAVVIDTPPVTIVSDASLLAPYTDGVVLVIRHRRTHRGPLHRAAMRLKGVRARVRGVVMNAVRGPQGSEYGYGYKYGERAKYGYGARYGYGKGKAAMPPGTTAAPGVLRDGKGGKGATEPAVEVRVLPSAAETHDAR